MSVTTYKIWAVGSSVGVGATQSIHVGIAGVAKCNKPGPNTTVANELVCNRLASTLLLPVPPGFLIEHNGEPHFVSLNFNLSGQKLPPADPALVVAAHPELSWGIILFDMWILNGDRHNGNLNFDSIANKVQIFDHSHALFAYGGFDLNQYKDTSCIGGHCLAAEVSTLKGLNEWHRRIMALPEFFVRSIVQETVEERFNVDQTTADRFADFLIGRRSRLFEIAMKDPGRFPKVPSAAWTSNSTLSGVSP